MRGKIKLTVAVVCNDPEVAAKVQDHFRLDVLLAMDGVTELSAEWLAEVPSPHPL